MNGLYDTTLYGSNTLVSYDGLKCFFNLPKWVLLSWFFLHLYFTR